MPGQAPIVGDERDALRVFLEYHQSSYPALAFGLTDDQARSKPTVSALSIGGLIKHATGVQRSWMERAEVAPNLPPQDTRPFEEVVATYQDEYVMREDETLQELLDKFKAQNAETLRILDSADLDTAVPVPQDVPWFPKDITSWTVRWVIHHLINELARHAGQADIIRESIDGATLYDLVAGIEGWEETEWIKPWKPAGV
ncbi:MAG: hypothetical protein JWQ31_484 [Mycobacterium sp.]|jgi:uncharacterized damage-inducible protein DinB|nr:hypothetical protein [Mycobacterium sp.]MDT5161994.1 hypothetical protein [Mycobacterium sp.]